MYLGAALIPCNTWLFFSRIRAITRGFRSQVTLAVCVILWISTFTSFLIIPGFRLVDHPTEDGECNIVSEFHSGLLCVPFVSLVVFDTATIITTWVGLMTHSQTSNWLAYIKTAVSVKHMGRISRVFLRSGQIYYLYARLITIGFFPSQCL